MKTKFIVMAAMAAMFSMGFTACSNNDDEMGGKVAQARGIGFDITANNAHVTRGLATNAGSIIFTNFQTWGYDTTDDILYMGESASSGRTVTFTDTDDPADGVLDTWVYNPVQFWPVNPLAFVAIAPASAAGVTSNATALTSHVVGLTTNVTLPTNVEDQDDIMFAASRAADVTTPEPALGAYGNVTKDSHGGDVPLNFQHALSQIVFQGQLPTSGAVTEVEIEEITLGNIGKTGTLTFTSAGTFYSGATYISTSTPSKFSLDKDDLQQYTWGTAVGNDNGTNDDATAGTPFALTVSNSATAPSAKPGNAWFMLPQQLTAWVPGSAAEQKAGGLYSGSANVDPSTGAYLKIRAKLSKNGVVILGKAESDAVYIPINQTWERGKKYIYTIEFNGEGALTPITFSVTAEDWVNASPQPGLLEF